LSARRERAPAERTQPKPAVSAGLQSGHRKSTRGRARRHTAVGWAAKENDQARAQRRAQQACMGGGPDSEGNRPGGQGVGGRGLGCGGGIWKGQSQGTISGDNLRGQFQGTISGDSFRGTISGDNFRGQSQGDNRKKGTVAGDNCRDNRKRGTVSGDNCWGQLQKGDNRGGQLQGTVSGCCLCPGPLSLPPPLGVLHYV
jgi:hypothetical protein